MTTMTTTTEAITAATTVREAVTRYPALEAVFERHGIAGCGGPNGPLEPIGFFAAVHRVNPQTLIAELNAEAVRLAAATEPPPPAPAAAPSQAPTYRVFLRTAIVLALTLGFTLGATLLWTRVFGMPGGWGFAWWLPHVQMHGAVQLFGFMGLFIMGVALHVVPRLKAVTPFPRRVALRIYGFMLAGLTVRILAHIPSEIAGYEWLAGPTAVVGGALLLTGSALFAHAIFSVLRRTQRSPEGSELYLGAAVSWLTLGAAASLAQAVYLAATAQTVVPDAYNEPVLHGLLVGFAAMFTFAISLRVLPSFLNLPQPSHRKAVAAFWLLNAGLAVRLAGSGGAALLAAPALDAVARLGTLAEAAGLIAFALTLAPWRGPQVPVASPGGYSGYVKFVRTGYVWLIITALLEAGLAGRALAGTAPTYFEVSAARHALALGFLTLMVTGVALRIVPVFGGTLLAWPRLGDAAFWLVLASVSLRVPLTLTGGPWPDLAAALNGASGVLGATGLAFWGAAIWRTLDVSGAPARRCTKKGGKTPAAPDGGHGTLTPLVSFMSAKGGGPVSRLRITETMTPAETLDRNPETMPVFLRFGFSMLQEAPLRATLGRSVTLAQAASLRGVNLAALLEALNQAIAVPQPAAPLAPAGVPAAAAPAVEQAPAPAAVTVPDAAPAPLPPVPATEPAPADAAVSESALWNALRECYDPEIPVNIVDLGLVYHLTIAGSVVQVQIGLTSPTCPLADQVTADVIGALLRVPGVMDAQVEVVEEPQWTMDRMSEAAREQLGWPAPPGPNAKPMLTHF